MAKRQPPTGAHLTYQLQYRKCNRFWCKKCVKGQGHGPYWYAYWTENGRPYSKYIGVNLPAGAEVDMEKVTETAKAIVASASPELAGELKRILDS